jgi:hypothetical protein
MRVAGTIAGRPFAGIDPRRQSVRLQLRDANGTVACCTLPPRRSQRLFGRTYGFFDPRMQSCPNIRCVKLALPASGSERATVLLGKVGASMATAPLQLTLSAGDQCTQGEVLLQPGRGGAVFP